MGRPKVQDPIRTSSRLALARNYPSMFPFLVLVVQRVRKTLSRVLPCGQAGLARAFLPLTEERNH